MRRIGNWLYIVISIVLLAGSGHLISLLFVAAAITLTGLDATERVRENLQAFGSISGFAVLILYARSLYRGYLADSKEGQGIAFRSRHLILVLAILGALGSSGVKRSEQNQGTPTGVPIALAMTDSLELKVPSALRLNALIEKINSPETHNEFLEAAAAISLRCSTVFMNIEAYGPGQSIGERPITNLAEPLFYFAADVAAEAEGIAVEGSSAELQGFYQRYFLEHADPLKSYYLELVGEEPPPEKIADILENPVMAAYLESCLSLFKHLRASEFSE